jgi:hypothetical protein
MKRRKQARQRARGPRVVRSWKKARPVLERWRKAGTTLRIRLRRPREIDVVPIDFLRGEPAPAGAGRRAARPTAHFSARLIFFTAADLTVRRPSGAILVIDNYEVAALSDGRTRIEPVS